VIEQGAGVFLRRIFLISAPLLLSTCSSDRPAGPQRTWLTPTGQVTFEPPEVLVGAGDIAECDDIHDEETATVLDGIPGTVFAAGDIAYDNGSDADFLNCYGPTWGRHKARTRPVPGNHEYNTPGATGYYNYFGAAAGQAGKGYYSYDLGQWHIIALNNYISMDIGSEQDTWLRADLAASTSPCKLAYYHEPLYSSTTGAGSGGISTSAVRPMFATLYDGGVDVVLNGHRHFYERLAAMSPDGHADVARGIREFIVGTGGSSMGDPTNAFPLSEVRFGNGNYGVLKLYLYVDSYAWKFVPVAGRILSDSGSAACHTLGTGVSVSQSTVTATPSTIALGGSSTIAVTVKDGNGQPMSGATVQLAITPASGAVLTQPANPTGANGVATGSLSAPGAGDWTVSATVTSDGVTTSLLQTARVSVAPPSVITHTLLTAGNNTVNQQIYTTPPISPAANALITVAVMTQRSTGAPASLTVTGGGMTSWTQVASLTFDNGTLPLRRLTLFRALSAAPGSGPLTITSSANVSNVQWTVSQWSGVDLSGVNGSGAIAQIGSTRADGVTSLTLALGAFSHTNNVAYGVFGVNRNVPVISPGAGFNEISENASGETTPGDLEAEWRANDNTIDASWPLSLNGGALGVEIKAAASGSETDVDALQSTVSAAPASIMAGSGATTITVVARNANGAPLSNVIVALAATGAGNVLTQPGPTDGNGMATGTLSATVAEAKTISAVANGIAISQHASVNVTAGAPSGSQSTITSMPTSIQPGGQTAAITVTVKDNYGNPINGAAVALSAMPGSGVDLTQPTTTDAAGIAVGALSSTVAEDKTVSATVTAGGVATALNQTVVVTVTPQGATAITTTLLTADNNAVNQRTYMTAPISPAPNTLVTVAVLSHRSSAAATSPLLSGGGMSSWTEVGSIVFDAGTQPLRRLTLYRAMSATPGSGPLTITFNGNVSNAQWIVSQWAGVDQSGVNGSGAIVQVGSTHAEGVTGLTVPLAGFGHVNNVAYGAFGVNRKAAVIFPGSGFTEIAEEPSGETTTGDLQAEWRTNDNTIDAGWPLNLNGGALGIEIKAAASNSGSGVDPSLSTIEASPPTITPGDAGSSIEVTVRDAGGAPISGATVQLFVTGTGNTLSAPGPTDQVGVYQGNLSSTRAGTKTVSATARIGSVTTPLTATATVVVNVGPVSSGRSTVTASPTSLIEGTGSSTVTVTVVDAQGNPISGASVQLYATGTGNTLSAPGLTDASGIYTGTLSSTIAGAKTVSARATISGVTTSIAATTTVTVLAAASASLSTVEAAPASIATGTGSAAITVTVRDANGDPISGSSVELAATGAGNTLSAPGLTDANGVLTGTLSSTVAGEKVVSATASGTAITQTASVTVTAEVADAGQSTVVAVPNSITVGTGSAAITVTAQDAHGNRVAGATVELAATGNGNTLSAPGPTDANGVYTGTLSSTAAGDKVVSATVGGTAITQTALVSVLAFSPSLSTVAAAPSTIEAGTASATITVTVRNGSGDPVSGVSVALAATGAGNVLSAPGLTDVNGVYTGSVSSTVVGAKVVSATADGTGIAQTASVTVTAGPLDAGQSTVAAAPSSITAGSGSSTITVTAKDAHGNPVPDATVQLAATGSGNTLSAPALTNANGVYTGSLSSTTAGEKVVSATAAGTTITQTASVTVTQNIATITQSLLTAGNNVVNQRVYSTAAFAPQPNTLITVTVLGHSSVGTPPIPTLSGGGMGAWSVVTSVTFDGATPTRRLTIFRAMSAAPGSGPLTITSAITLSNLQWSVSQWSGAETSGANGAGGIAQSGSVSGDAVNGLNVPLAAFTNASNVAFGAFGVRSQGVAVTPGAGFTEISENASGESTPGDLQTQWGLNLNTIRATWAGLNGAALGLEIKAAITGLASSRVRQ
jgi:adhesin/invasin